MLKYATFVAAAYAAEGVYDYKQLGADWSSVSALCGTGKEQSPINLNTEGLKANDAMHITGLNYKDYSSLTFKQAALTAQDVTDGFLRIHFADGDDSTFIPLQFHFHAPSEHTVDGKTYDLEMHMVHLYPDGSLGAVIGIFFDMAAGGNTANQFIAQVAP